MKVAFAAVLLLSTAVPIVAMEKLEIDSETTNTKWNAGVTVAMTTCQRFTRIE